MISFKSNIVEQATVTIRGPHSLLRKKEDLFYTVDLKEDLTQRKIGFKVLSGQGVNIDTTTPAGKMIFSIFGALAEFEREMINQRAAEGRKDLSY